MEWEGKVDSAKLVCAASGQPIAPGALFFSGLVFRDALFVRQDYAETAWAEVDKTPFISWWRQRAPTLDAPRFKAIDSEALLGMFHALKAATERPKQCFVYVVLLYLVRARKLRFRDSVRDAEGHSFLVIEDRANRCLYRVRDPGMSVDEERAVQDNLLEVIEVGSAPIVEDG
ncbi:MAG: hypothetical protein H0W72_17645 [Planctomycetes bacterium]|nr:hypothetical protein [Planctomycetota bacterium]